MRMKNLGLLTALVLACGIASAGEASANGRVARGALALGKWALGSLVWDQLTDEDNEAQAAEPTPMTDICETGSGSCVLPYPGPSGISCYCVAADGTTFEGMTR